MRPEVNFDYTLITKHGECIEALFMAELQKYNNMWLLNSDHAPYAYDMVTPLELEQSFIVSHQVVRTDVNTGEKVFMKKNGEVLDDPAPYDGSFEVQDLSELYKQLLSTPPKGFKGKDAKKEDDTPKEPTIYAKGVNPRLFNAEYSLYEISQKIKRARKNEPDLGLTLMFYGVPGTGKTYAVKYIADKLKLPYKNVVLSDLLGKYVGETEKAISKAFAEAKNGILHIDEFDSLTGDRDAADRNHEVSRVNAFLQAMDDFKGILIVTTNLIHKLDKAVIRRFMMKQEFDNLTQKQARAAASHFFPDFKLSIEGEGFFAPADFNLVKRSLVFEDMKKVDEEFITKRLTQEALARNGYDPREEETFSMGFDLH